MKAADLESPAALQVDCCRQKTDTADRLRGQNLQLRFFAETQLFSEVIPLGSCLSDGWSARFRDNRVTAEVSDSYYQDRGYQADEAHAECVPRSTLLFQQMANL